MKRATVFLVLALFLADCAPQSMAGPLTASAPTMSPSSTLAPSSAPTTTPSIVVPSETSTPEAPTPPTAETQLSGGLDCKLLSQSVRNGAHFGPRERFDVGWKVRNNGDAAWDPNSVVFTFLGGTKMFRSQVVQLVETVPHGQTVALVADMVAPRQSGKYTTFWTLRSGTEYFCRVSLTINVP